MLDEASMLNCAAFTCIEEVSRCVMNNNLAFGGKAVILLGDFRQTCPVVPRGSHAQVINVCIQSLHLWSKFEITQLRQLIWNALNTPYADYINAIEDGAGPEIDLRFLSWTTGKEDLIKFVFSPSVLCNPLSCLNHGIVAPTNKQVNKYNSIILDRINRQHRKYFAADSLKEASDIGIDIKCSTLDYVARQTLHSLPPHCLEIKTNAVYRLLRNFSIDQQLVKNVWVIVTELGTWIITIEVLCDHPTLSNKNEEEIVLPRITFSQVLSSLHTLICRQFPLVFAYSTTIHSCQGQTYDRIGIDLTKSVFTHGQLYTTLSRVRHHHDVLIRLGPDQTSTTNVTFHEILLSTI